MLCSWLIMLVDYGWLSLVFIILFVHEIHTFFTVCFSYDFYFMHMGSKTLTL